MSAPGDRRPLRFLRERQLEGIALAEQQGAYTGRKKSLSEAAITELRERLNSGVTKAQLARELGISRETLYQICE